MSTDSAAATAPAKAKAKSNVGNRASGFGKNRVKVVNQFAPAPAKPASGTPNGPNPPDPPAKRPKFQKDFYSKTVSSQKSVFVKAATSAHVPCATGRLAPSQYLQLVLGLGLCLGLRGLFLGLGV